MFACLQKVVSPVYSYVFLIRRSIPLKSCAHFGYSIDSVKFMHINPLGFRVVVKVRKSLNKTQSGLYIPEGAKETNQQSLLAEVTEVASAIDHDTNEETNISGIPLGALVLISANAGVTIPWDETLRIVETHNVLAIVEEIKVI